MQHVTRIPRNQMVFTSFEDSISKENPVRFVDAFVENIDLKIMCFELKTEGSSSFDSLAQRLQTATKKAVLSKNCFMNQNSTIDIPIREPSLEKKLPEISFNGLSFLVLQTKRKLSY